MYRLVLGPKTKWQRIYQVTGFFFLALSVFVAYRAINLEFYTILGPGAGFFPLILAVVLSGFSIALFLRASIAPMDDLPAESDQLPTLRGLGRVAVVVLALSVVAFLFERIGFRPVMAAFLFFMLTVLGGRRYWTSALFAAGFAFGTYYLFVDLLGVPLPLDWILR